MCVIQAFFPTLSSCFISFTLFLSCSKCIFHFQNTSFVCNSICSFPQNACLQPFLVRPHCKSNPVVSYRIPAVCMGLRQLIRFAVSAQDLLADDLIRIWRQSIKKHCYFTNITNSVILTGNCVLFLSGFSLEILLRLQKQQLYFQNLFCSGKKLSKIGGFTLYIAWKLCANKLQKQVKLTAFDSTYMQPFNELLISCSVPHFLHLQTFFSHQRHI